MGFKKPMDYTSVHHQIYMTGVEVNSSYNDGYTAFYLKQDLYRIKWLVDSILKDSPEFAGEDEFLKEHEQKIMWRRLQE
jgi:hypothetical protein